MPAEEGTPQGPELQPGPLAECTTEELAQELCRRHFTFVFVGLRKDSKDVDCWTRIIQGGYLLKFLPTIVADTIAQEAEKQAKKGN